ncbi:MAG TPA: hypothetical protein V6D47_11245, partial [Oscillatoriaceae cyanobacterium]
MQIIETSLYSSQRTIRDLQELKSQNVTSIVEPITYMGTPRRFAETYLDDYERLIVAEAERCAQVGIEHLTLVGVPAMDANLVEPAHKALDYIGHYLGRKGVVGIGEVGFERMTHEEESVFRRQARMARATGLPIVVQAPLNGNTEAVHHSLRILSEEQVKRERILFKGVNERTISTVLEFGVWAGLTIHPAALTIDRVLRLVGQFGTGRVMLQSDAGRGYGDPFAVPRTAQALLS